MSSRICWFWIIISSYQSLSCHLHNELAGTNLAAKNRRRKRTNSLAILLLPALIFLFFMGWSIYWTGDKKDQKLADRKEPKKENVTLLPAIFEETEQIRIEWWNKQTLFSNHLQLSKRVVIAKLARLLLQLHNHNSIYTAQGIDYLARNSHPRGTPMLGGSRSSETWIAKAWWTGASSDSRLGLTWAVRQACF